MFLKYHIMAIRGPRYLVTLKLSAAWFWCHPPLAARWLSINFYKSQQVTCTCLTFLPEEVPWPWCVAILTLEPYRSHIFIMRWADVRTITPVVSHWNTQFSILRIPWRTPNRSQKWKHAFTNSFFYTEACAHNSQHQNNKTIVTTGISRSHTSKPNQTKHSCQRFCVVFLKFSSLKCWWKWTDKSKKCVQLHYNKILRPNYSEGISKQKRAKQLHHLNTQED